MAQAYRRKLVDAEKGNEKKVFLSVAVFSSNNGVSVE